MAELFEVVSHGYLGNDGELHWPGWEPGYDPDQHTVITNAIKTLMADDAIRGADRNYLDDIQRSANDAFNFGFENPKLIDHLQKVVSVLTRTEKLKELQDLVVAI